MSLRLTAPPAKEPFTLQEARTHLRLESGEDQYLTDLIAAARRHCESFQGRAYVTQTWDLYLNGFPQGCIKVPLPPLQEITWIKYKDSAGCALVACDHTNCARGTRASQTVRRTTRRRGNAYALRS